MSMYEYEKKVKKATGDLTKTGVGLLAGHAIVGGVANVPGMPAQGKAVAGVVGTGLNLVAVGQMAKTAYTLLPEGSEVTVTLKKGHNHPVKKKLSQGVVGKILG